MTENQSKNLVEGIKIENKKRPEAITILFTLIEDQQHYYDFKLRSVGPLFAKVFDRLMAFTFFAEKDLEPLVGQNCKTQASIIKKDYLCILYILRSI